MLNRVFYTVPLVGRSACEIKKIQKTVNFSVNKQMWAREVPTIVFIIYHLYGQKVVRNQLLFLLLYFTPKVYNNFSINHTYIQFPVYKVDSH